MNLKEKFIIELDRVEVETLKIFLGKFSLSMKRELGLTDEQSSLISEIWEALPYRDDE